MFAIAQAENTVGGLAARWAAAALADAWRGAQFKLWLIRAGGFGLMLGGALLVLNPISTIAGVVPLVGPLLQWIAGTGVLIVALGVTVPATATTIAIAWLWYRPMLSVALLAGAAGALYLLKRVSAGRAGARGGMRND